MPVQSFVAWLFWTVPSWMMSMFFRISSKKFSSGDGFPGFGLSMLLTWKMPCLISEKALHTIPSAVRIFCLFYWRLLMLRFLLFVGGFLRYDFQLFLHFSMQVLMGVDGFGSLSCRYLFQGGYLLQESFWGVEIFCWIIWRSYGGLITLWKSTRLRPWLPSWNFVHTWRSCS